MDAPPPPTAPNTDRRPALWRELLLGPMALASVVVLLSMIFVYIFAHGNEEQGIWTVAYARGLITLLFSVGTIVIAVILALTAIFHQDADAKERFDRAKEILTILIGVFGTIVGFYFGSLDKGDAGSGGARPTVAARIEALGGVVRRDSVFLDNTGVRDEDLAILQELPGVSRLDLDNTTISDAGLRNLRGLKTLKTLSLRGTMQVTDEGVAALKRAIPGLQIDRSS